MFRTIVLVLCILGAGAGTAIAQGKGAAAGRSTSKESETREPAAKQLSGMSIVGNDEAPKALYIVPWKSSEIGGETSFTMMMNERAAPVDRDVFTRQLEFYEISIKK